MNCDLLGFHSHEPATSAFPQCLAGGGAEEEVNPGGGPAEEEVNPGGGPAIGRSGAGQRSFAPSSAPRSASHIQRNVTRREPRFAPTPPPGPVATPAPTRRRLPRRRRRLLHSGSRRRWRIKFNRLTAHVVLQESDKRSMAAPHAGLCPTLLPPDRCLLNNRRPLPAPSPAEASTPPAEAPQVTPQPT